MSRNVSDPLDDGNYSVQGMVVLRGPPNLDLAKVNRIVNELRLATMVPSHLAEILLYG